MLAQAVLSVPVPVALATLFAALASTLLFFVLRANRRGASDVWRLTTPTPGHWLWGHELEVFKRPVGDAYSDWLDAHGSVFKITGAIERSDILVSSDPLLLAHIFSHHVYSYIKTPMFRPLMDRLIGKGIVWAEGDDHKRMKGVLGQTFTSANVKRMEPAVLQSASTLANLLRTHVTDEDDKHPDGVAVNLLDWTSRATLDIIGRVGFGHDFQCGTSPEAKEIASLWREQVNLVLTFAGGFLAPLVVRTLPFIPNLPLPAIQAQGAIKLCIRRIAKNIIAQSESSELKEDAASFPRGKGEDGNDLLSLLVRTSRSANGKGAIEQEELLDHITTFVMAGHETTATTIGYALHALAENPEVQIRLRAELDAFGREPTYDDLTGTKAELSYLDAVCKETLRLFPAGAHLERMAVHDDIIPLKTPVLAADGKTLLHSIRIKEGQLLYVPTLSMNTVQTLWGPDGTSFNPSRWLPESTSTPPPEVTQGGWNHLTSFSEGPRICLGWRLAVFELKAIVAGLVREMVFTKIEGVKIQSRIAVSLQPFVVGEVEKGVNLPVRVSLVHGAA